MLGLGNAINKARRRTVFVSVTPDGPGFNVLAYGSLGEAGYVISWFRSNSNGLADENGSYITYTEVYPSHYSFGDDNEDEKATLFDAANDIPNHIEVAQEGEEDAAEYTGWRSASPGEFQSFLDHIYDNPAFTDDYQSADASNPYLVASPLRWSQYLNDPNSGVSNNSGWYFAFTDGDESINPTVEQINGTSHYFLVVRRFTPSEQIVWSDPTSPPNVPPEPVDPGPEAFQLRTSGGLIPAAFEEDNDDSINLSVNGDILEGSDFSMYLANPTNRIITSDADSEGNSLDLRFQLQFTLKFPVDPNNINSAFSLPDPWNPNNQEQKRMRISMLNLGYKDIPFYSPNPTVSDVFDEFGTTGVLDFLDTDYADRRYPNIEVLLNKVTQDDMTDSDQVVLGNGFFLDTSTGLYSFAYTGYLNVKDFKARNLSSAFDNNQKIEDLTNIDVIGNIENEKRFFMLRVESIEYGTTTRPYSELIGLPENMRYIMFPILPKLNTKLFFNSSDPDYLDFVDSLWSSTGQNLPPEIPGQTEDYYD